MALKLDVALFQEEGSFALDVILLGYAQILFSNSRWVGALLLLATAFQPTAMLVGLGSVALAGLVARGIGLSPELIRSGLFSYNALLLGLGGVAFFEPSLGMALVLFLTISVSVLVTAALHSALGATFALPALTLPFLLVIYGLLGAAPALGLSFHTDLISNVELLPLPALLGDFFRALGALFFDPRAIAGLLVAAALLLHSRIGFLLVIVGFVVTRLFTSALPISADSGTGAMVAYNGMLVAYCLGGVFFVPGRSAFLFAALGAAMAGVVTLGLGFLLITFHMPVLILPFNLTMILILYAMRQRIRDQHPKSVDFISGTPEQNLDYYRSRIARFGARYAIKIRAPFLGKWICTQGINGDLTHKGHWRHGLDFEVQGMDGKLFSGEGSRVDDFYCYRLPILSPAYGTVARVVDGIPDNEIGQVNLERNWGNLVIVYHAYGFYSLVAHLSPGSIRVQEGQIVQPGEELGRCGCSGRAPTPHLHFQLQATARVGAPTLPMELHDVLSFDEGLQLHNAMVPQKGQELRNLEPRGEIARLFEMPYGKQFRLEAVGQSERIEADIDLLGGLILRSLDRRATLYYDHRPQHFTIFDTLGDRRSALKLLQMALGRVPFEAESNLSWRDYIPLRRTLPAGLNLLYDFLAPFVGAKGVEMRHEAELKPEGLEVRGRSLREMGEGGPLVITCARLDSEGIKDVEVSIRGWSRRWTREEEE